MTILKKIQYNSPVILTYTVVSFLAYLLNVATNGISNKMVFSVYNSPMSDPLFYVRLFGHVIGHVDFNHYSNNFFLILLIGPVLEEKYGSLNILYMILITAFVTGISSILTTKVALLGASGVVFMFIILVSFVNIKSGRIPLTFLLVVAIFIGKEIYNSVYVIDNISKTTHIVGGICGIIFGYFMNKSKFRESRIEVHD